MVTIKDVARMAGVSTSTVSRTLSGKIPVDESTKSRVLACVKELGYRPNTLAKGLKEGKTNTIAFLIPNIDNPIYPTLAIAVETEARRHGYFVLLCNTQEDQAREQDYVEKLKGRSVDGFIFSTALTGENSQTIMDLKKELYPTVCLMRTTQDNTDSIITDSVEGAYLGTNYLIERGHKKIVTITGRRQMLLYCERTEGYIKAMRHHNLPVDDSLIWSAVEDGIEKAYNCVYKFLSDGNIPQAIFAQSDPLAFDAMRAIYDFGLTIPGDISVLGFDDVSFSRKYNPPLSTVAQPLYKMGTEAAKKLINIIEGREAMHSPPSVYTPTLIERGSIRSVT